MPPQLRLIIVHFYNPGRRLEGHSISNVLLQHCIWYVTGLWRGADTCTQKCTAYYTLYMLQVLRMTSMKEVAALMNMKASSTGTAANTAGSSTLLQPR